MVPVGDGGIRLAFFFTGFLAAFLTAFFAGFLVGMARYSLVGDLPLRATKTY